MEFKRQKFLNFKVPTLKWSISFSREIWGGGGLQKHCETQVLSWRRRPSIEFEKEHVQMVSKCECVRCNWNWVQDREGSGSCSNANEFNSVCDSNLGGMNSRWDPSDFTINSPNIFLWNELWKLHSTFHKIIPRKFICEIEMNCEKSIVKIFHVFCWFLYENCRATTGSQRELWKERRKFHKKNCPSFSVKSDETWFHKLIAQKIKLWSEILNVPMVIRPSDTKLLRKEFPENYFA